MPAGQGCCAHNHDCEASECGPAWSLHKHIDLPKVTCLNEAVDGSCRTVFKPWNDRLNFEQPPLQSNDDDPELLIHIPFDGEVKLRAICIIGGVEDTSPSKLRVFINREGLDFATVEDLTPVQEWDLTPNPRGEIEYPTQVTRFNGVHSLDLHIPTNFGADQTAIHFIGLKGEFTERKRQAVEAVYEVRPVPTDHKVPGTEQGGHLGLGM